MSKQNDGDCPECELCCALQICCPPGSAKQRASLAKMMVAIGVPADEAERAAHFVSDALAAHVEKMKHA